MYRGFIAALSGEYRASAGPGLAYRTSRKARAPDLPARPRGSSSARRCGAQCWTAARAPRTALPPKADIAERDPNVRFVPEADSCTAA
jgi:hypothetical protein